MQACRRRRSAVQGTLDAGQVMETAQPLLEVRDLRTHFFVRRGTVKAVDGVSFSLNRGETLGLVGESGCGKSITCLSILRVVPKPAGRTVGGEVIFDGRDLLKLTDEEMRQVRGQQIAMILQDPMTSLNPVFTIGDQLGEAITTHQKLSGSAVRGRVQDLIRMVKISSPEVRAGQFPHQMSGGIRQRLVGALSLANEPQLIIADEPTTSLDVTIQAQYLRLLNELQQETGASIIFVTHDFGIVAKMCHKVAVMYAGKIVEAGPVREIFNSPSHPYTQALLNSVPKMEKKVDRLHSIQGQPPSLLDLPAGCTFAPRCPHVMDVCWKEFPPAAAVGREHTASCWLHVEEKRG